MVIIPPHVSGFPYETPLYPLVQPFTYRDGTTYLEILHALDRYVSSLPDKLNEVNGEFNENVNAELLALVTAVNDALVEMTEKTNDAVDEILNASIETNDTIVSAIVVDALSSTREKLDALFQPLDTVSDAAVAGRILSTSSETREALDTLYQLAGTVSDSAVAATILGESASRDAVLDVAVDGVTQPGPLRGAVQTVADSRYRPNREADTVFNVLDFGATPGGSPATNTAAFNAALAAAGLVQGTVIIPTGVYEINDFIELHNGVTVEGRGSTIRRTQSGGMIRNWASGDTSTTGYNGRSNIVVRDLILDANGVSNTGRLNILTFNHCRNIVVERVTFKDVVGYHSLELNAVDNAIVRQCRFIGFLRDSVLGDREALQIDCANSGSIDSGQADGTMTRNVVIEDCYFGASTLPAPPIAIGSHAQAGKYQNITVQRCHIVGGGYGVRTYYWDNSSVVDNIIEGQTERCILSRFGRGLKFERNTIGGSGGVKTSIALSISEDIGNSVVANNTVSQVNEGIYIGTSSFGNTVTGNSVTNSNRYGIVCEGNNNLIDSNSLGSIGTDGDVPGFIRITGTADKNVVSNNVTRNGGGNNALNGLSVATTTTGTCAFGNVFFNAPNAVSGTLKSGANNIT